MSRDADESDRRTLSPDDAFSALGNETRMEILQTLGAAGDALSFSALRERIGMRDSGQFNYHLDQLTGHFVDPTDDGYDLTQAGRRVIEAVRSGAVTDAPEVELTHIDESCHYCGEQVAVTYHEERLRVYCTECDGTYGGSPDTEDGDPSSEYGFLGALALPPAGVQGRTPERAYRAAWTWGNLEILATASGICPRCSAAIEHSIDACEHHDTSDGLCTHCERRHAVYLTADCSTCNYTRSGGITLGVASETALLSFLLDHDANPISPDPAKRIQVDRAHEAYTEDVRRTDPLRARLTFTVGDDELTLTIDDDLTVTNTTG